MTEYFKKVYIKTEDDLPANPQYLFCHHKKADRNECINYMGVEWDGEYFMSHIDWYLLPIEQKLDVPTEEEIEAFAYKTTHGNTVGGAKWAIDEIIKRNK